jgi:hypothetical protein
MAVVPYLFFDVSGRVPGSYLDTDFAYVLARGTGVTGFGLVTAKTANETLTADQSYQTFTNEGAAGTVTLSLPTPVAGLEFTFVVVASQSLVIDVGGSVVIYVGETPSSAGGSASANSPGSIITLKAISTTVWVATSLVGSWTAA